MAAAEGHGSTGRRAGIYVSSTPHHILLSAAIALTEKSTTDGHLLVVEHHSAASVRQYVSVLERWEDSPFTTVEVLRSDYRPHLGGSKWPVRDLKRMLVKKRFRAANRRKLDDAIERWRPRRVYVGADSYFEGQYALYRAKAADPATRGIYVEDGTAAYDYTFKVEGFRGTLERIKSLGKKLRFGPWWRHVVHPGTSDLIDESWVAFPDLVIEELARKPLHALPSDTLERPAFRSLMTALGNEFGVDVEKMRRASLIVALTRSSVAKLLPGYEETMRKLCHELAEAGHMVAVKYHPREYDERFVRLPEHENLYVVPPRILFEALVSLPEDPGFTVIGDVSTALIATRWLRPSARVIAVRHVVGGDRAAAAYLAATFAALGIHDESEASSIPGRYFPSARCERRTKPPSLAPGDI
jgi:hypothetical protein